MGFFIIGVIMDISWIKLKTKMFDDEKIQLIEAMPEADAILVIWVKLLIQAGKTNSNGYIMLAENIPYSPEMLSTIFRRPLQIIRFALKTLSDLGMIELTERNVIVISNWEKHQNIEGLDKVREQNRIRQANYREKKLLLQVNNGNSITLDNVTVTEQIKSKNKIKNLNAGGIVLDNLKTIKQEYFTDMLPIDSTQQFIEAWNEWCDFRREIKKKLTKLSAKKQLTFLFNQPEPIKCINQSIQNGWTGLFEVTDKSKPKVIEHNGRVVTTKEDDAWRKVLADNEKKLKEQGAWDGKISL